ncbi:uncharacterized protein C8orf76-like [Haemaphysalis longicornis]
MEFAFEDDVFDSPRVRNLSTKTSFDAKICEAEWFLTAVSDDVEENMMLEKYRGDYHYMRNDSAKALEHYERCLNLAPKSATSVQRDCVDGIARCHLSLGRSGEALKCTEMLETLSTNSDHRVSVWLMQSEIYSRMEDVVEESAALCRCLLVRPWTSNLWYRLSKCYLARPDSTTNLAFKAWACLLKTRLLYHGALSGNQSFAKASNIKAVSEVDELLKGLHLPEDFTTQALDELDKDSDTVNKAESDEEAESLSLLRTSAADVISLFEKRWFSWIPQHPPDSNNK